MTEIQTITDFNLTIWKDRLVRLSVPAGISKHVSFDEISMMPGVQFPGVGACTPSVLYSMESDKALAWHIGTPGTSPDEVRKTMDDFIQNNGPDRQWVLHTAILYPSDKEFASEINSPEREANIAFFRSVQQFIPGLSGKIESILTPGFVNLSFRVPYGFRIVRYEK